MFCPKSHRLRVNFVKIDMQWRHTLRRARISTRTFHISWPIWVKFGTRDLHILPAVCRTNRYSESCTILRGAKKPFALFCTFLVWFTHSPLQTIATRHYSMTASFVKSTNWRHNSILGVCRRFVKIGAGKAALLLRTKRNDNHLCAQKPHHISKVKNAFARCLLRTKRTICKLQALLDRWVHKTLCMVGSNHA